MGSIRFFDVIEFISIISKEIFQLLKITIFSPHKVKQYGFHFAELYSKLWDISERSISNKGLDLPSAFANGPIQNVNNLLTTLYGGKYSCLSFGGSSGALITLLTAVIPKLAPRKPLILFDELCHQSTIGGLIFGRWQAIRIPRISEKAHGTVKPVKLEVIKSILEKHSPEKFAAIVLVLPSYDGFRAQSEELKIFEFAKRHNIIVIVDGAWDATCFHRNNLNSPPTSTLCDVWITSPHKRGLCPSSLGCIITNREDIAQLWDEALDLGFRSSSVSFVEIMIAEHRLSQIVDGNWNLGFDQAEKAARELRRRIPNIHPEIYVVEPHHVKAESADPTHILISTSRLPELDARIWAQNLSDHFAFDVEKATSNTLLLICASPSHQKMIESTLSALKKSLLMSLQDKQAS